MSPTQASGLCFVNLCLILVAMLLLAQSIVATGGDLTAGAKPPVPVNTEIGLFNAVGDLGLVVFAFAGSWMYFEIMSEMKQPTELCKAFQSG